MLDENTNQYIHLKVYEKKVTCLTDFNIEGRNGAGGHVNALNMPRLSKHNLRIPKVGLEPDLWRCSLEIWTLSGNGQTMHMNMMQSCSNYGGTWTRPKATKHDTPS